MADPKSPFAHIPADAVGTPNVIQAPPPEPSFLRGMARSRWLTEPEIDTAAANLRAMTSALTALSAPGQEAFLKNHPGFGAPSGPAPAEQAWEAIKAGGRAALDAGARAYQSQPVQDFLGALKMTPDIQQATAVLSEGSRAGEYLNQKIDEFNEPIKQAAQASMSPLERAALSVGMDWLPKTAVEDVTNPVMGAMDVFDPIGKGVAHVGGPLVKALLGGGGHAAAAGMLSPELVARLFPKLDKWGKPAGRLTEKTMLKRVEAATDLPRKARRGLIDLAGQIGARRVAPEEVQALARGEAYRPARVVRRVTAPVEGTKGRPGAPYGVTNARQERGLRERYLGAMERGVGGRDWYHDAGESILFHANDDPVRANLVAGDMAITSPQSEVSGNTGFGVKGYNQATAGVPVAAGRFPTAMGKAIEEAHAGGGGATGLKRSPFQQNMARGGGFLQKTDPPRAVHDIWDAEAHGFMNADGSPMRTGFGPAQHRWMDAQQDKILETANERALGGFTDWEELRSQAAAWTGQKIAAGDVDPAEAAKSFADHFAALYAQGHRDVVPGRTTGHMPELHQPGMEPFHQVLQDMVTHDSGIYDDKMRDQIAAGYGGLTGRAFEGPGSHQTQILTGSVEVPGGGGARVLDEGSRRILDASEATHALLRGSDESAYSRLLPAGTGVPRTGFDVTLPGGRVTHAQLEALALRLGPRLDTIRLTPTLEGVRIGRADEATMKEIVKMLGGKVTDRGIPQGNVLPHDWRVNRTGQGLLDPIRTIGTEKFDAFVPQLAQRQREVDARFLKATGGRVTLSPLMDEVRAVVAGEGFAGLERLAKKYAIPVALLAAGLEELGVSVPPEHSEGTGL